VAAVGRGISQDGRCGVPGLTANEFGKVYRYGKLLPEQYLVFGGSAAITARFSDFQSTLRFRRGIDKPAHETMGWSFDHHSFHAPRGIFGPAACGRQERSSP
jgi:hypothetical protein